MKYSSGGIEIEIDESDLAFLNKAAWKKAFKDAELDKNFVLVSAVPITINDGGTIITIGNQADKPVTRVR